MQTIGIPTISLFGVWVDEDVEGTAPPSSDGDSFLLEDGDNLLLEDESALLMEIAVEQLSVT